MCRENEGVEQDKYFFQGSTPHVRGNHFLTRRNTCKMPELLPLSRVG